MDPSVKNITFRKGTEKIYIINKLPSGQREQDDLRQILTTLIDYEHSNTGRIAIDTVPLKTGTKNKFGRISYFDKNSTVINYLDQYSQDGRFGGLIGTIDNLRGKINKSKDLPASLDLFTFLDTLPKEGVAVGDGNHICIGLGPKWNDQKEKIVDYLRELTKKDNNLPKEDKDQKLSIIVPNINRNGYHITSSQLKKGEKYHFKFDDQKIVYMPYNPRKYTIGFNDRTLSQQYIPTEMKYLVGHYVVDVQIFKDDGSGNPGEEIVKSDTDKYGLHLSLGKLVSKYDGEL